MRQIFSENDFVHLHAELIYYSADESECFFLQPSFIYIALARPSIIMNMVSCIVVLAPCASVSVLYSVQLLIQPVSPAMPAWPHLHHINWPLSCYWTPSKCSICEREWGIWRSSLSLLRSPTSHAGAYCRGFMQIAASANEPESYPLPKTCNCDTLWCAWQW